MVLIFNNINPTNLLDELIKNNIQVDLIQSDIKENEYVAETVWVTLENEVYTNEINNIVKSLDNTVTKNTEENLIDKLILDNINMQMQIDSLIESQLGGN